MVDLFSAASGNGDGVYYLIIFARTRIFCKDDSSETIDSAGIFQIN